MTADQLNLIQLGDVTPSKATVSNLANQIAYSVKEGLVNPVETAIHLNAIKSMCEEALKLIVEPVTAELSQFPQSKTEKWGCKIEQAEVGTKYDYSQNVTWVELKQKEDALAEERKALETLLKAIPAGKSIFNDEGIEMIGPAKTSTTSFKTTLAK